MATNQLLPFGMGESPNRIPFEDWNTLPSRLTGFQSGIASSQQFNYILAQGGVAGYILAQLIVEQLAQDATLESADTLYTNFKSALAKFIPTGIADKSIATAKLADLAVTAAKIAANAVETAKIKDAAVTAAKLASNAVETAKIKDAAVTNAKIAAGVLTFDRLAAAAIATKEEAEAGTSQVKLMTPWAVAQAVAAQIPPAVPTGMIAFFDLTQIPDGWLLCDGSAVSRTTYANLFAKVGTRHGAGDGSTTFNVPDMNARFLEGTTDTGQVGTKVEPGLPNITGGIGNNNLIAWWVSGTTSGALSVQTQSTRYVGGNEGQTTVSGIYFDASKASDMYGRTSTVQPNSLRVIACIKT